MSLACIVVLVRNDTLNVPGMYSCFGECGCSVPASFTTTHHHLQLAYRRWYKQVKLAIYHHDGGGGAGLLSIQQRNWRKSSTTTMQSANCFRLPHHTHALSGCPCAIAIAICKASNDNTSTYNATSEIWDDGSFSYYIRLMHQNLWMHHDGCKN